MTRGATLDRNHLPESLLSHPAIVKAVAELQLLSADPVARRIYEGEEKSRMVDAAQLEYATNRGIQQGIQQGIEQGMRRERQHLMHLLIRQMTRLFGEAPSSVTTHLETLDTMELSELGESLFDLQSYGDVEAWFDRQRGNRP